MLGISPGLFHYGFTPLFFASVPVSFFAAVSAAACSFALQEVLPEVMEDGCYPTGQLQSIFQTSFAPKELVFYFSLEQPSLRSFSFCLP